ncbi:MAG: ribonuclease III [Lachnospiraceae bacterium]|nr:ribonuclease III [Lachnospiraceae bacterium]
MGLEQNELAGQIASYFEIEKKDVKSYSPLTLAFLGDNIFDLVIRTILVQQANKAVNQLHKKKSTYVKAEAQALMADTILPELSEEEASVYRRGRNAKSYTMPKNAKVSDYRKATGLEALMGYLFLQEQTERILELIKKGMDAVDAEK